MTDRQSSAGKNPKREIHDAEFEEVQDYPEPRQWKPTATTASPGIGFTEYIFDLLKRRSILRWWMWITFIASNSYILLILQRALEVFGWVAFGVTIWPGTLLTDNIGGGLVACRKYIFETQTKSS